ncbi:MAG: hypothetical protein HETSPECPRED_000051 [Heterodermia speciosa]|uniref:Smr domain-containing protein n=1 Tax=Heterodermia speciosa TaxID=116794 RepID=A0A8H3I734_9LECA|nr:MAG: hypothetical protein HETSPECPRED_000051 [Heterodermia speciosa]
MSYPLTTQLGGHAFNHNQSQHAEAEYDRLRTLARQEHDKRSSCMDNSHNAYQRGDGASAHALSEEGKRHGAMMDQYNKQASDYIFRENNAVGRVDGDTIDLHGQFVEEAEDILEQRIKYAQSTGQTHLHVIVGKGNHSPNHIQKIKPRVEQVCQELGLQYSTEANAGRMYINLQGGPAQMPQQFTQGNHGYHPNYGNQQSHHGGGYQQQNNYQQNDGGYQSQQQQPQYQQQGGYQQQQQHQNNNNNQQNEEIEKAVKKYLPKVIRQIKRSCCTVM